VRRSVPCDMTANGSVRKPTAGHGRMHRSCLPGGGWGSRAPVLLVMALLVLGCDDGLPTAPDGAYLVPHDARFYSIWSQVESCSGLSRNPDRTRRYIVPGDRIQVYDGYIAAYYDPKDDAIFIAEGLKDDDATLAHEILHVLLIKSLGIRGHPDEYFVVRCHWANVGHAAIATDG
jgi:hypothetical protein